MIKGWLLLLCTLWMFNNPLWALENDENVSKNIIEEIYENIQNHYIDEVPVQNVLSNVRNLLQYLDQHSNYHSPEEWKGMQESLQDGEGGLGIVGKIRNGKFVIESIAENSPANDANLMIGDVITQINQTKIKNLPEHLIWNQLQGPIGSEVILHVQHGRQKRRLMLVRQKIFHKNIYFKIIDRVGYIQLKLFKENSALDVQIALQEIHQKCNDLMGFILDLRNNPGGLLDQAIELANTFLENQTIVRIQWKNNIHVMFQASHKGYKEHRPLIILINQKSASATEIVAGALQEHQRAILIGQKSYGKGSIQDLIPLSNGGGLQLTVAKYYTPNGKNLENNGITPDITIPEEEIGEEDSTIKEAVQTLKKIHPSSSDNR